MKDAFRLAHQYDEARQMLVDTTLAAFLNDTEQAKVPRNDQSKNSYGSLRGKSSLVTMVEEELSRKKQKTSIEQLLIMQRASV